MTYIMIYREMAWCPMFTIKSDIRQLTTCLQYTGKQRIKSFGHVMSMTHTESRAGLQQRTKGHRSTGKPWKKWIDGVVETVTNYGMNIAEDTSMSQKLQPRGTRGRNK